MPALEIGLNISKNIEEDLKLRFKNVVLNAEARSDKNLDFQELLQEMKKKEALHSSLDLQAIKHLLYC